MKKLMIFLWLSGVVSLFFYSFTQIDLNLTLSQVPIISNITKSFQYIGYFQRPLSLYLYIGILLVLFISYFGLMALAKKKRISERNIWTLLLLTAVILLFSYPAFSYDIYNYMFDAKTIIVYQSNPWQFRPLDFPGDPWLSFMHWTHRPSVYPPFWILLSLPFYLMGWNFFITTLFSFKMLMSLSFVGSVWLVGKLSPAKSKLPNLVLYGFNPLLIIENLVSGHNDIVMMFFALLGVYLFFLRKKLPSLLLIVLSVLIKYVTALIIPLLVYAAWKKTDTQKLLKLCFVAVFAFFLFWISRVEIQPWYLVWLFPFAILVSSRKLTIIVIALSFGLLLRYAPFLLQGDWSGMVPFYNFWLTLIPVLASVLFMLLKKIIFANIVAKSK